MSALEELYIFVVDSDWLLMCDSEINERGLLSEFSKQFFFLVVDIYIYIYITSRIKSLLPNG